MIVRFDTLHRFEVPTLTLCNPDSVSRQAEDGILLDRCIGRLNDVVPPMLTLNFNAFSELSFTCPLAGSGLPDRDSHTQSIYAAIQPRRYIYAENFGYFLITSVREQFTGGLWQKQVTAQSCEKELCYRYLPGTFEEGTQTLSDVLDSLQAALSPWEVEHIDDTLLDRYRTFESVDDKSLYDFLLQDVQEAYACVCEFDCRLRRIFVYDMDTYAASHRTSIHLTRGNVVNELLVEQGAEELYTVLDVEGGDGLSVQWANPIGSGKLYRFTPYLSWMSPALQEALGRWQTALNEAEETYLTKRKAIRPQEEALSKLQQELAWRTGRKETFQTCLNRLNAADPPSAYEIYQMNQEAAETLVTAEMLSQGQQAFASKISEEAAAIASLQPSIQTLQTAMQTAQAELAAIHRQLDFSTAVQEDGTPLFDDEQLRELSGYLIEGRYVDSYVTAQDSSSLLDQSQLLYERGKRELEKLSTPSRRFDISTESFVFIEYFRPFTEQLESGCVVQVETEDGRMEPLHLTAFTIDYDGRTLDMTFGSKYDKYDIRSLFDDVFGEIQKSASSIRQFQKQTAAGHPL